MTTNEFKEYVKTRQALNTEEIHRFMDEMSLSLIHIYVVGGRAGVTEYYMYDATNIRLRELSVGYQLPAAWMEKAKVLKRAQLSFSCCLLYTSFVKTMAKGTPFSPSHAVNSRSMAWGASRLSIRTNRQVICSRCSI